MSQDNPAGAITVLPQSVIFQAEETDVNLDPGGQPTTRVDATFPLSDSIDVGAQIGAAFIDSAFMALGVDLSDICISFDFGEPLEGFEYCLLDLLEDLAASATPVSLPLAFDLDVGGYFELQEVGGADVSILHPADVTIEYPAANSFSCGDTIVIRTSCSNVTGGSLSVTPPTVVTDVGLAVGQFSFGGDMQVCLPLPFDPLDLGPICSPSAPLPIGPFELPDLPPLFTLCPDDFDGTTESLLGCGGLTLFQQPSVLPFLDVDSDPNTGQICLAPGVLTGIPELGVCFTPASPGDLQYSANGLYQQDYVIQGSGLTEDLLAANTDLVEWVDLVACPGSGVTGLGCTKIDLGVITLDLGDISPTYSIDQAVDFQFINSRVHVDVDFAIPAGSPPVVYRVLEPATGAVVQTGVGTGVTVLAGQHIEIDFPSDLREPIVTSQTYDLTADLQSSIQHHYYMGIEFRLLQFEIDDVLGETLYEDTIFSDELDNSPVTVQDATITIDDYFTPIPRDDFSLDPENPVINVTRFELQDIVNIGNGQRAVMLGVDLHNAGDVTLDEVGCDLDLAAIFASASGFEVTCVHSDQLTANAAFNGQDDINLLGPGNLLSVDESATIDVVVVVEPEIAQIDPSGCFLPVEYSATVSGHALSFIGTPIMSNVDECTGMSTGEDIVVTMDLGASIIEEVQDYAVYGTDSLILAGSIELSRGNAGSAGTLSVIPLTAATSTDPRIIGDLHVGGDLHVNQSVIEADYLQLVGDDYYSSNGVLNLTGAASMDTACAALFSLPVQPAIPAQGGANSMANAGQTVSLDPGHYSKLELRADSTVQLTAGVYDVHRLIIGGDGATLLLDDSAGPVTLNVQNWRMGSNEGTSILSNGNSGDSRNSFINYNGLSPLSFRGGTIVGTLVAPRARVQFQAAHLQGACHARTVLMGPFSSFTHHDYLEDPVVHPACFIGE